jgi:5-methylcytosine-specific restriction endonuclease McrA
MSIINKIPRGLRVLLTIAILAILIWRLAAGTEFYYYAIGAAVLLTAAVILAIYRHPIESTAKSTKKKNKKAQASASGNEEPQASTDDLASGEESSETIHIEADVADTPAIQRGASDIPFNRAEVKPDAADVAARYIRVAGINADEGTIQVASQIEPADKVDKIKPEEVPAEPPIPLIEDKTVLTEEEKNELVNAVWYRCENPYCKYTHFLGVHHIVDEKEGGTNKLDNLIVLCPYCHDLAHRGEVPENQMREWISNREERFKFKPNWRYFK